MGRGDNSELFLKRATRRADALFSSLDRGLNPKLLLVGLPIDSGPAVVQPADCGYDPDNFNQVIRDCKAQRRLRPDADGVDQTSVRDMLEGVLHGTDDGRGAMSFSSSPVRIENRWICIVLQLNRAAVARWPSLTGREVDGERMPVSLVDGAAIRLLRTCQLALFRHEYHCLLVDPPQQILREAATALVQRAAWVAGDEPRDLFGVSNSLASLTYEGQEAAGSLVVARRDHPSVERIVTFEDPVPLNKYRRIRKLLQLSEANLHLLTNGYEVLGLGRLTDSYDPASENIFVIAFCGRNTWEFCHAASTLVRVVNGQPELPRNDVDVVERLRSVFPRLPSDEFEHLRTLVRKVIQYSTDQRRGATLIISRNAAREAKRLTGQCIRITPTEFNCQLVRQATAIDGATMIDTKGRCHALGVILDGRASAEADPARGSRYNSALSYVEGRRGTLAVVVSEDGSVDPLGKDPACRRS